MKIHNIFVFVSLFLTALTTATAQTWIVPANGSAMDAANSKIGITGTSATQGHLQIVADNGSQIRFYTGTPTRQRVTIDAIGNVGIGTTAPGAALDIQGGQSSYLRISRSPSTSPGAPNYGECGIVFSNGASFKQGFFPAYSSGALNITNGSTSIISLYESRVDFGGLIKEGDRAGRFNFDGLIWSKKVFVSNYANVDSGWVYNLPEPYKFGVNGLSNFQDNVVIGKVESFTKGFPAGYKLFVSDGIISEKFKCAIKTTDNWSDFVFAPDYKLMDLKELEKYIGQNKHLPGIPSADEVVKNGLDLGQMNALLLQKIEELTLHMIRLEKENEQIRKQLQNK